jgi:MFS transporter, PAT family, beta-lactamase induction signal transducer AmpG
VTDAAPRRRLVPLFALLYFSEGAPIGFIWWALPTLLRDEGLAVGRITSLMAMLVLPWTLKFLWAPVVDVLRGPRWKLRSWITSSQIAMGLCLVPLFWLEPIEHFGAWAALLLLHAVFAATQDVAIDALAVRAVDAKDRGWVNGAMQAGMILGRSLFGGVGILIVSRFGWPWVFAALLLAIWGSLAMLRVWAPDEPERRESMQGALRECLGLLAGVAKNRSTWFALAFALIGGAAFEAAGALAGPFMIDRGVEKESIGAFFAGPTVVAMLAGGLIGGRISDAWGRVRSVASFLGGVIVCVLVLAALPETAGGVTMFAAYGALYFCIGLFTASSYALFMDLTDAKVGATQFSAFMAATNGCEAWATWAGGRIVEGSGYALAFALMAAVSGAGLIALAALGRARSRPAAD